MTSQQNHEMQLVATHSSGAEEWLCPECGRRFVAQWEPNFRRVILEPGDEMMAHKSQWEGLQEQILVNPSEDNVPDDIQLSDVWKKLLDKLDFDPDETNDTGE